MELGSEGSAAATALDPILLWIRTKFERRADTAPSKPSSAPLVKDPVTLPLDRVRVTVEVSEPCRVLWRKIGHAVGQGFLRPPSAAVTKTPLSPPPSPPKG